MTPQTFLSKWRNAELKERTASQSHFNDLRRISKAMVNDNGGTE
jgi:hypothetical protein